MRKSTAVCLIVAGALIVAGLALVTVGLIFSRAIGMDRNMKTNEYEIREAFEDLVIDAATADIRIVYTNEGGCRVKTYENPGREQHVPTVKDGTLTVERIDLRRWYERLIDWGKKPSVTVYLPAQEWGDLSVRIRTGDVHVAQELSFENLTVKGSTSDVSCNASAEESLTIHLDTGDIEMRGNAAKKTELTVTTGEIEVERFACTDLYVKVSTGDAELSDVACTALTSEGSTGDLSLENVTAEEYSIDRSTGDVTFERCGAKKIRVKTDTGRVQGTLLDEMVFYVKTDTGKVRVPKSTTGGLCEITTDTGDILFSIIEK